MVDAERGWAWFNAADPPATADRGVAGDRELVAAFARCLQTEDGWKVMRHLRAITLDRALGPSASDSLLRHVEGQRRLVAYIADLVDRGGGRGQSAPRDAHPRAPRDGEIFDE